MKFNRFYKVRRNQDGTYSVLGVIKKNGKVLRAKVVKAVYKTDVSYIIHDFMALHFLSMEDCILKNGDTDLESLELSQSFERVGEVINITELDGTFHGDTESVEADGPQETSSPAGYSSDYSLNHDTGSSSDSSLSYNSGFDSSSGGDSGSFD